LFTYIAAMAAESLLVLWLPVIALQLLLLGPLAEELCWRGYALDALQEKWGALVSSLVLGFFWPLWHLPLVLPVLPRFLPCYKSVGNRWGELHASEFPFS
jgi:membrane protease YdiL (CAAX protease family)